MSNLIQSAWEKVAKKLFNRALKFLEVQEMMTLSVSQHTLFCNVWLMFATINFKLSIADCNTRSVPFNTDCNASKSRSSWREK